MSEHILKSYISRLGFIKEISSYQYNINYEIQILNNDLEAKKIEGIVNIKNNKGEIDVIIFETQITYIEDILVFKSKYHSRGNLYEKVDTFALIEEPKNNYYNPKTKTLIHIIDGQISQIYRVGKKYKLQNGISESLSKLNMGNKDIIKQLEIYKQIIQSINKKTSNKTK